MLSSSLRLLALACVVLFVVVGSASGVHGRSASFQRVSAAAEQAAEAAALLPGEGTSCNAQGTAGKCTAGACSGTKVAGFCPGPASVKCCLPKGSSVGQSTNSGRKSLTKGNFPYSFPYATGRHIVADVKRQRMRLYDGRKAIKEWKMSSGKNGVSFVSESWASPVGRFRVIGKYGDGQPSQMRFEALRPIGKLGYPTDAKAWVQTRILQLDGMDIENANTRSRAIYIHGTNAEMQLGWMGSHGCFRMGNKDIIELFNLVKGVPNLEFYAIAKNAWP